VPDGWPRAGSNIRFVTDGLDSAVGQAKAVAGNDKFVGVATASIIQQLLNDGQLDAIHVNLVPVLLGAGVPFFAKPRRCRGSGSRTQTWLRANASPT
jgi:dihydrofolate reductase